MKSLLLFSIPLLILAQQPKNISIPAVEHDRMQGYLSSSAGKHVVIYTANNDAAADSLAKSIKAALEPAVTVGRTTDDIGDLSGVHVCGVNTGLVRALAALKDWVTVAVSVPPSTMAICATSHEDRRAAIIIIGKL